MPTPTAPHGSVWGKPAASPVVRPAATSTPPRPDSQGRAPAPDGGDFAASAASALLGLQHEPVKMSHKQVEQHRRLKAKQYFNELRCLVPGGRDPKNDRNKVLQLAIEHMRLLRGRLSGSATAQPAAKESAEEGVFTMDAEEMGTAKPVHASAAESEADKRLSHNEVEQKRRLQARHHYDDLRELLPNAAKFDKNTVLAGTIQAIKHMAGVTDQALAKMVGDLPATEADPDNEGATFGVGARAERAAAASCLEALVAVATPLSESPSDVVSFSDSLAWGRSASGGRAEQHKESRKRAASAAVGPTVRQLRRPMLISPSEDTRQAAQAATAEGEGKDPAKEAPVKTEGSESAEAAVEEERKKQCTEENQAAGKLAPSPHEQEERFEDEMDGLDALSLLAGAAVQLQASQPSTPQQGPAKPQREMSWGETSFMSALLLPGPGKTSMAAAAAATAAAKASASL